MSKLGLADVCEQAQLSKSVNLLVVVDQFEELFRYSNTEAVRREANRNEARKPLPSLTCCSKPTPR